MRDHGCLQQAYFGGDLREAGRRADFDGDLNRPATAAACRGRHAGGGYDAWVSTVVGRGAPLAAAIAVGLVVPLVQRRQVFAFGVDRGENRAAVFQPPLWGNDLANYPSEVLNRATRVFGVNGYMLGDHLLLRRGHVVAPIEIHRGGPLRQRGCPRATAALDEL